MSWVGFKKAINRTGTQFLMKTGYIETTNDEEYNAILQQYKQMEAQCQNLQKMVKTYLEFFKQINSSERSVVKTLNDFFQQNENICSNDTSCKLSFQNLSYENASNKEFLNEFVNYVNTLENELIALDEKFGITVFKPIIKFNNYFNEINDAIKKREHKKLDFDLIRSKVKKNQYTPEEFLRLQEKLNVATKEFNKINKMLKIELSELFDLKSKYLQPTYDSLIQIQLKYVTQSYCYLGSLEKLMTPESRNNYANGILDEKIEETLNRMTQLNITCDNPALSY